MLDTIEGVVTGQAGKPVTVRFLVGSGAARILMGMADGAGPEVVGVVDDAHSGREFHGVPGVKAHQLKDLEWDGVLITALDDFEGVEERLQGADGLGGDLEIFLRFYETWPCERGWWNATQRSVRWGGDEGAPGTPEEFAIMTVPLSSTFTAITGFGLRKATSDGF